MKCPNLHRKIMFAKPPPSLEAWWGGDHLPLKLTLVGIEQKIQICMENSCSLIPNTHSGREEVNLQFYLLGIACNIQIST